MTAPAAHTNELDLLRLQAQVVRQVVRRNLEGVTHEESLIQPEPGGNCLNWVLGHLLWAYEGTLPLLRQKSVMPKGALDRYARGGSPITDPAEAWDFSKLEAAWNTAADRIDAGFAGLDPEVLNQPAPFSPSNDPSETVRSLLATTSFHQAYHAGQTALLRRLVGREGAIR